MGGLQNNRGWGDSSLTLPKRGAKRFGGHKRVQKMKVEGMTSFMLSQRGVGCRKYFGPAINCRSLKQSNRYDWIQNLGYTFM